MIKTIHKIKEFFEYFSHWSWTILFMIYFCASMSFIIFVAVHLFFK
jgi:hypothetical protein